MKLSEWLGGHGVLVNNEEVVLRLEEYSYLWRQLTELEEENAALKREASDFYGGPIPGFIRVEITRREAIASYRRAFEDQIKEIAALKRENETHKKALRYLAAIDNVWVALTEDGITVSGARGQMLADALLTNTQESE